MLADTSRAVLPAGQPAGIAAASAAMRVAYLVNEYPKVSHAFIRREVAALRALGVEVLPFSVRAPGELVDPDDVAEAARTRVLLAGGVPALLAAGARDACARPWRLRRARRLAVRLGWRSHRGLLRHLAYLLEAARLRRWLVAAGVQHLHAHFGTNPATVALLCRALGGPPFSFTVHGPEEFDAPVALGLADKIRHAEFVVAVSSYGRGQLYRWCAPADWPKVHVVRCAVDEGWLAEPPAPIDGASRRLVCVGRLCPQKGQLLLLEAAAKLRQAGEEFELVLVGDGEQREAVAAGIARLGLGGRVRITGWASGAEVRTELRAARACVLPSFAEGLPVVLMEALALGRPVIATAIAGIPELVAAGENGWLLPAGDADQLTAAMRAALTAAPAELERMGRAGRARVASRHRAASEAASLRGLFAAAVARAAPRA